MTAAQIAPSGDAGAAPCAGGSEREAFEAWARGRKLNLRRMRAEPARYLALGTGDAWEAWQASASRKLDMLLAHCPDAECPTCSVIICPHQCSYHFHHDGCPACAEAESRQAAPVSQAQGATTVSPAGEATRPNEQDPSRAAREGALPDDKDAARYRWLCEQEHSDPLFIAYGRNGTWGECGHSSFGGIKELADKHIDAAMSATGEQA